MNTIQPKQNKGFTLVELLIVIVIIGILVAISIVAYNGITEKARFATMRSDLSSLNKAIQLYYADNGHYPISGVWFGYDRAKNDDFIPGLAPEYISSTPQLPTTAKGSYLYRSPDGVNYKLIRWRSASLSESEQKSMKDMMTTDCLSTINDTRWGYWNSDVSKCW